MVEANLSSVLLLEAMSVQEHGLDPLTVVSMFSLVLAGCILVNIRIRQMTANHQDQERSINRLINVHQWMILTSAPFFLGSSALKFILQNPSELITKEGCYALSFISVYLSMFMQCQSFFVALFRYLLIVHTDFLNQRMISAKKLSKILSLASVLVPLYLWITTHIPARPSNAKFMNRCLGRWEVHYDFDYFTKGGFVALTLCSADSSFWGFYICQCSRWLFILISSNIVDFYFLLCCVNKMRSSTRTVASLLSARALAQRKRSDGVIITITLWQWFCEALFFLVNYVVYFTFFLGELGTLDFLFALEYSFFTFFFFPSLYLVADAKFRNDQEAYGFFVAYIRCLTTSKVN